MGETPVAHKKSSGTLSGFRAALEAGASIAYDCPMDFRERLQRATQRGEQSRDAKAKAAAAKALTEEQCQRMHREQRLTLIDHIERCLKQLADNFPGFNYEDIANERGWGGAVRRDDLAIVAGKRENQFSRLEMVVSPHNQYHVIDVSAKGAIRNKENFTRNHYQLLKDADLTAFQNLIEQWTLDYAEQYAATR